MDKVVIYNRATGALQRKTVDDWREYKKMLLAAGMRRDDSAFDPEIWVNQDFILRRQSNIKKIVAMAQRQAMAAADRERIAIAVRTIMIYCYAMIQAGLSPKTVQKVRKIADDLIADKFDELKKDGVAEAWLRQQLEADGLKFQEIPPEVSFDFV